ncbi:MAG: hypothetical protein CMJ47_13625 [Planctomyces sp.]|nr:hypothetical protein [Planctomyces sp.]
MSLDQDYQRFLDLKSYVGWTDDDNACSDELLTLLSDEIGPILDDFYTEIKKHRAAWRVITGGDAQVTRLKSSLARWLQGTLQADHDQNYVAERRMIGYRHVDIGLDHVYVNAAFSRVRLRLNETLSQQGQLSLERRMELHSSLGKRLDLDLAIMSAAYQAEYQSRQVPVDQARLQQQKLLARLSRAALADADLEQIHFQTVSYLSEALQADLAEFVEWNADHKQFLLLAAKGWPEPLLNNSLKEHDARFWQQVIDHGSGVNVIDDWQMQTEWQGSRTLAESRVVTSVVVAVRDEQQLYGAIGAHFQKARKLLPSDLDYISSLANLLVQAFHRKRIERQKLENASQLRRLVDLLPAGAVYVAGNQLQVNQAVERMTGFSRLELVTRKNWEAIVESRSSVEDEKDQPGEKTLQGVTERYEVEIRRKDGQKRLISQMTFQSSADEVWLLHDVTEQAERHRQELQAERLAAIGQMIAGLTHESRNALQRIQACNEMLELKLEDNEAAMKLLERSQKAQNDLQKLFNEVRNYASPLTLEKEPCELARILEDAWNQSEVDREGRAAELEFELTPTDIALVVDRFRISQVFRNFFENSLSATSGDAKITVSAEYRESAEHDRREVLVTVRDNGPGLTTEVAEKIFEPFFTTKTKGSGLGMAIAARIIASHHGTIEAVSHPGAGAEFLVRLPAEQATD